MSEAIDLFKLVLEVDDELIQEGAEPWQRPTVSYMRISRRLNPSGRYCILQYDPLYNGIQKIYKDIYRQSDLNMPPMHVGAFMFRDIFFPLHIPIIYGTPSINPIDFIRDISDTSKQLLLADQQARLKFLNQFADLMDFTYGLKNTRKKEGLEFWKLAKQHLEAASATILGSFDKRAIIQNCCVSTELLLKGALLNNGIDQNSLKKYGHNLEKLAVDVCCIFPQIDGNLLSVIKEFPNYVNNRYDNQKFSRLELGEYLMNAQFISGEILRQFSDSIFIRRQQI